MTRHGNRMLCDCADHPPTFNDPMKFLSASLAALVWFTTHCPQPLAAENGAGENVEVPIVINNGVAENHIVIHIDIDGTIMVDKVVELQNEDDIKAYIQQQRDHLVAKELKPILYLRGDREALFKHSRMVIKSAAEVEVNKVMFSIIAKGDEKPEPVQLEPSLLDKALGGLGLSPKPRESDLNLALPKPPKEPGPDDAPTTKIHIDIAADGKISVDGKEADADPNIRKLPLLKAQLKRAVAQHPDGAQGVRVEMTVAPAAKQQRVIDVLNALAAVEIQSVTFKDLDEPKKKEKPSSPSSNTRVQPR